MGRERERECIYLCVCLVGGERQLFPISHFRKQIVREQRHHLTIRGDLYPHSRTGVVVKRGLGIGSHTGRRVRDEKFKTV